MRTDFFQPTCSPILSSLTDAATRRLTSLHYMDLANIHGKIGGGGGGYF